MDFYKFIVILMSLYMKSVSPASRLRAETLLKFEVPELIKEEAKEIIHEIIKSQQNYVVQISFSIDLLITNVPVFKMDYYRVNEALIESILKSSPNSQLTYIMVFPDTTSKGEDILKVIRSVDNLNNLIVFYRKAVNIAQTYKNDPFYNTFFVTPTRNSRGYRNSSTIDPLIPSTPTNGLVLPKFRLSLQSSKAVAHKPASKITYLIYSICMFCDHGKHEFIIINEWCSKGFIKAFTLKPSFAGSFHSSSLRVSINGTSDDLLRLNTKICLILAQHLKVRFSFIGPTDGVNRCLQENDGKIGGMIGDLIRNATDIVAYGCYGTLQRYKYVDFSVYVQHYDNIILSGKPPKGVVWYSMFKSFDLYTWILILASIPIGGSTLFFISSFSIGDVKRLTFRNSLWAISVMMWKQNAFMKYHNLRLQVLIGAYGLMAFIIVSSYMSTVIGYITVPQNIYPPIDTKEQFILSSRKWLSLMP